MWPQAATAAPAAGADETMFGHEWGGNMKVRYNPVVGVVSIVLGAVCEFFGLWLLMLGEFSPAAFVGLFPILIGVLYFARPYFLVDSHTVAVPALVGPVRREFPYDRLEYDKGKLVAVSLDGSRKKVPVTRWLAHSADWTSVASGVR
jgi:hypothetical protein